MGTFDALFGTIANFLPALFASEPAHFERVKDAYDPLSDTHTPLLLDEVDAIMAPPYAFKAFLVDGVKILGSDRQSIVSSEALGTFDPLEAGDIHVFVTRSNGAKYRVMYAEPFNSGDAIAAYGLHLRP